MRTAAVVPRQVLSDVAQRDGALPGYIYTSVGEVISKSLSFPILCLLKS